MTRDTETSKETVSDITSELSDQVSAYKNGDKSEDSKAAKKNTSVGVEVTDEPKKKITSHRKNDSTSTSNTQLKVAVGAVVVVLIIVAVIFGVYKVRRPESFLGLFSGDHTSGDVNSVLLYETASATGIDKLDSKTSFEHGKPIVLTLKLDKIVAETVYSYDVQKSDSSDSVRKGTIQVKPENTTRYITLVTSDRTALETGKYKFHLKDSSGKEIVQRTFSIK
ncbi:MAG: hypothetical protein LBI63_01435 [Candidatus Ancillula sp.]|jgi:hypothetical protein|nr:hypothetical protein [Candidatus Ancillula sp.]